MDENQRNIEISHNQNIYAGVVVPDPMITNNGLHSTYYDAVTFLATLESSSNGCEVSISRETSEVPYGKINNISKTVSFA